MGRSIGEEKIMGGMDGRVGWMCMIWKRRKKLALVVRLWTFDSPIVDEDASMLRDLVL